MSLTNIVNAAWSAPITLSSAKIWEVRGGPIFITTDPAEADLGGIEAPDGWVRRFEIGQDNLRYRVASGGSGQLVRVEVS